MSDEFRLTPLDVRKSEFRKAMRGYDAGSVEDFRSRVADEFERVVREKIALEERLRVVEAQLDDYRQRDRAMNDALIAAQQMRSDIREAAEREAQLLMREAEAEADRRLEKARRELERIEQAGLELSRRHSAYLTSLRALVERQKAELDTLASSDAMSLGTKVAGTIQTAQAAGEASRKPPQKWIKSISEE